MTRPVLPAPRDDPGHRRRNLGIELISVVVLTVIWCLLWGDASAYTVVGGALLSIATIASFPLPPIELTGRVAPIASAAFCLRLLGEIVVASLHVARQALTPGWQPHSVVLRVDLHSNQDLVIAVTAGALSVVPGSVVLEVDRNRGVLYLHVLDARTDRDVAKARLDALLLEARVLRAIGSQADLASHNDALQRARVEFAAVAGGRASAWSDGSRSDDAAPDDAGTAETGTSGEPGKGTRA